MDEAERLRRLIDTAINDFGNILEIAKRDGATAIEDICHEALGYLSNGVLNDGAGNA